MADEREDLETFLKDVDEVGLLIKNLSSPDEEKQSEAMKACDTLLANKNQDGCITATNRTLLSTKQSTPEKTSINKQSQDQFLKCIELDANERASRRQKNEAAANTLKAKGNDAFKAGRYEDAIVCYSEALNIVKYLPNIYTNRAQAYINTGNYDAAIDDCKWAIKLDDNCIKAYVHCGRALQRKACFTDAISYFEKAEKIDPKNKDIIKDYISAVQAEQEKSNSEHEVNLQFDNGDPQMKAVDSGVKLLLDDNIRLNQLTNITEELTTSLENNDKCKTLFRLKKGFDCFSKQSRFNRLCAVNKTWELPGQECFVLNILSLAKTSIEDNECNLKELLDYEIVETIHKLIKNCSVEKVEFSSLLLLYKISEMSFGRYRISQYAIDQRDFIEDLVRLPSKENLTLNILMGCMNNLTLEERFSLQHSNEIEKICLSFANKFFIRPIDSTTKTSRLIVTSSLSTLANLARIKDIRNTLQTKEEIWELFPKIFERCVVGCRDENIQEIVNAGLGLLLNLLFETSEYAKKYCIAVTVSLDLLLTLKYSNLLQRTVGVLRLLMTYFPETMNVICEKESYKYLLDLIKQSTDDQTTSYCVKCLTLCSADNEDVRNYISKYGLMTMHQLLKCNNPVSIGNCCLILRSCFQQKEACDYFNGTSIVKDLLILASSDTLQTDVKHNAAIALAKLVSNDSRFLEELRQLQGLEILHSVLKTMDSIT